MRRFGQRLQAWLCTYSYMQLRLEELELITFTQPEHRVAQSCDAHTITVYARVCARIFVISAERPSDGRRVWVSLGKQADRSW